MEYGGETGWTVGVTIWPQHMEANKRQGQGTGNREQGTRGQDCGEEAINSIPLWLAWVKSSLELRG
jgi:hypothetical protein